MVVPRFSRNSTLQQLLDDHMVERIVYNIGEHQELIPSRHKANMIFDRYWSYLQARGINVYRPCTTRKILQEFTELYRTEHRRFKFRILRGYLLYRTDPEDERRYLYRIHYSSDNTRWQLQGENQAGWCTVNNTEDFNHFRDVIHGKDIFENLTVPTTSWNVLKVLYFHLDVRRLMGARMGSGVELPEHYKASKWGQLFLDTPNMCFWHMLLLETRSKMKIGRLHDSRNKPSPRS